MNPGTPKLVILSGPRRDEVLHLESPLVLGRHPDLPGRIPDVKVSREHSKIFAQAGDYYIVDLNSRNGTQVNGSPITRRQLRDGDEILLGETQLRFEMPAARTPEPMTRVKPKERATVDQVIDLGAKASPGGPAGSLHPDQIKIKDRALQFSKTSNRKKLNPLLDDMGQRPFLYQLMMILLVLVASVGFLFLGLFLAGVIGG